ncbi:uncharacterized protein N7518_003726 [Penicillium psychrosexuale]|uniref:uncharacterized protein n=1 Tax=Penicillium psychrosexuale TaxID=1002107 RepID=UPI0025455B3D|nr:uncharacterized protein N7518_003726 [Penicillium psychrosexuale]KAJ5801658.1 hypothetical protein N7518_003726 [Penicillium psychrosexuale]
MNTDRLVEGDYDIFCPRGDIKLTEEDCVRRVYSGSQSSRENSFRHFVRARDGKCVLTGVVNKYASEDRCWVGFEAAHIFPMVHEGLWRRCNLSRFITRPGRHTIHSVQNGLLVTTTMHHLFDSFLVSVNPDDCYKITDFGANNFNVDGRVLDIVCRNPNNPDPASTIFPPGTDMMKEILQGPVPAQRMELELFSRLQRIPQEDEESPKTEGEGEGEEEGQGLA